MKKIKLRISFNLIEDVEKQEERFGVTEELKRKVKENADFLKSHIRDIEKELEKLFDFGDLEWIENLSVEVVEVVE